MTAPARPSARAATVGGLLVAAGALRWAADGILAPPASPTGLTTWFAERDPATAGMALVRLVAEVTVWYTLALTLVGVVATLAGSAAGRRLVTQIALPGTRRLVHTGMGLGLTVATSLTPATAGATAPPDRPTVAATAEGTAGMRPVPATTGSAWMRPVPDGPANPTAAPTRPTPPPPTTTPAPTTWTVTEGESLWSIAHDVLHGAWGTAPTDAEIAPYWRRLIEDNRGRLVDADDPDLIHPGQRFSVPAVPER